MKKYFNVIWLALIWSMFYIITTSLNKQMSPLATGSSIRMVAVVALTLYMAFKKRLHLLGCSKKLIPLLVTIGCLGFLLDLTSFIGLQFSTAGTGTVLLKVDVIIVQIMSIIIYREKFDKLDWLLTFVMLAGVMLVMGVNPFAMTFQFTDLFFVLSAFFVSVNAFIIQKVQRIDAQLTKSDDRTNINSVIAYYNNGVATLLFLIATLVMGQFSQVQTAYTTSPMLYLVIAGGIVQVLIYIFYYKALAKHPVWIVKTILLLIPVFTLIIETVYTRSLPAADKFIGTAIVLISAAIVIIKHGKAKAKEA